MSPRPKKMVKSVISQMKTGYKPKGDKHAFGYPQKTTLVKRMKQKHKP